MINVMIADSELFIREGIKNMLAPSGDVHIVCESENVSENNHLLKTYKPDVIILEIAMAEHCGVRIVRQTRQLFPASKILVMSYRRERDFALRAFRAGARGFVRKDCSSDELMLALRTVAKGRPYISEAVSELLAESITEETSPRPHDQLSDSDFEMFWMFANGKPTARVAHLCNVSIAAVRSRRSRMMERMYLHTEADLIEYAVRNQLIDRTCLE